MRLAAKGLATEVKQEVAQDDSEVSMIQVELGDLCSKIAVPFK